MENILYTVPNPFPYFLPVFFGLIGLEAYLGYREDKDLYNWQDSLSSVWVGAGAALFNSLTKLYHVTFFFFLYELAKPLRVDWLGYESLGWGWWAWLLCFLGDDFNFYWHHRFCHTVRLFWAAHIVHHSSEKFNFGTAFRNSWTVFLFKPMYWFWLPLLGFHPVMIALCMSINSIYQFFLHSTLVPDLGWFGKVFNTPWDHQVHHACNVEYLDRNHGGTLIIWDKFFGTFQSNRKEIPAKFGVLHPPQRLDPLTLNFHEFADIWRDVKQATSWKDKLKYVFYPPGWSPDGSRKTAKQMQMEQRAPQRAREMEWEEKLERTFS